MLVIGEGCVAQLLTRSLEERSPGCCLLRSQASTPLLSGSGALSIAGSVNSEYPNERARICSPVPSRNCKTLQSSPLQEVARPPGSRRPRSCARIIPAVNSLEG